MSEESDETLLASLSVITNKIREQALVDFEEFYDPSSEKERNRFFGTVLWGMLPKNWARRRKDRSCLLLHSMTEELKDQPWYVQAAASKLIPVIQKAADNKTKRESYQTGTR